MFGRYLIFELKRQSTSVKTIIVTVVFFLFLVIFLGYSALMHQNAREQYIEALRAEESILTNFVRLTRVAGDHEEILAFVTIRSEDEENAILYMINEDLRRIAAQRTHAAMDFPEMAPQWERMLAMAVARHERLLVNFYAWRTVRASILGIAVTDIDFDEITMEHWYRVRYTESSLMSTIQRYRYLQNKGIPISYSHYDPSAFQLIYRIITTLSIFILPMLAILLSADIFSKEGDSGGYKILLQQPLSRIKIYMAKLVGGFAVCFAAFVLPLVLVFGIAGLFFGFGSPGYAVPFSPANMLPATVYETSAQVLARLNPYEAMPGGFIAIGAYLLRFLPYAALFVLFMVGLTAFISMIASDSVLALASSLGFALISFVTTEFVWGHTLWNPIVYADINQVIIGGNAEFFWIPALCAAVLIVSGIVWFRRKDIIC